jgi:hypothetical protein
VDGFPNDQDPDDNGNAIDDEFEDIDGDGITNDLDSDDDNDDIPDNEDTDADNDGFPNSELVPAAGTTGISSDINAVSAGNSIAKITA